MVACQNLAVGAQGGTTCAARYHQGANVGLAHQLGDLRLEGELLRLRKPKFPCSPRRRRGEPLEGKASASRDGIATSCGAAEGAELRAGIAAVNTRAILTIYS